MAALLQWEDASIGLLILVTVVLTFQHRQAGREAEPGPQSHPLHGYPWDELRKLH